MIDFMKHPETAKTRRHEEGREGNSKSFSFLRACLRAFAPSRSLVFSIWCAVVGVVLMMPAVVMARPQEPDKDIVDGRLEGYAKNVTLEGGSVALTWLLMIFLAGVCLSVMFKNAKRTHLD